MFSTGKCVWTKHAGPSPTVRLRSCVTEWVSQTVPSLKVQYVKHGSAMFTERQLSPVPLTRSSGSGSFMLRASKPVLLVARLNNLWIWRGQNSSNTYRTTLLLNQSVVACDLRLGHRETHTFLDFLFILNPGCRWSSARNSHSASPGLYGRYDDIIVSLYWTSNFKTKLTSKFRITAYTAAVWTCLVCPRDFRFYLLNIQTCK